MKLRLIVLPPLLLLSSFAIAQTTDAHVSGLITDPTKAVIVGASVVAVNVDTGVRVPTKTNASGYYSLPALTPGNYQIQVAHAGFKSIVDGGLVLHVQDAIQMNFEMAIGSASETVSVNAADLQLNTTDGSVSTVIDQSYVRNMPLNGRSFQDLILLTPGAVTQTPQASSNGFSGLGQTGEFSVNGQRTESNNYTVDGVSANVGAAAGMNMTQGSGISGSVAAATALGTTQALVSVDDLQEFRVQSSTYSAEYGRNPGGQFAFETKSGTNQWQGTAYDYLRNGFFDAQDWFNDYFGTPEPSLHQNDFGATLGGPVEIPAVYNGKDKTFLFVSYEGLRLSAPQAATANFVPDATLRANTVAPLNQVLNAFPLPSPNGIDDVADGVAQFIGSWTNPASLNSTNVRFDHVVNDKLRLFFRFSDTNSSSATRGNAAISATPTMNTNADSTLRTYTAGASSVFSSRLSNDFRLNYSSNRVINSTVIDAFGGSTPADLVQLSNLGAGSEPNLLFILGANLIFFNQDSQSGTQRQWNFVDTANISFGHHLLKFGADYRRLTPIAILPTPLVTYLYFAKSDVETNNSLLFAQAFAPAYPLYTNFSAFAQDEWRISERLNLSFGLRWEVNPAPGVTQGLKPYTVQGSNPNTWTLAPEGTPLWQTTWYNFAPRVGLAYRLHGVTGWETVLRGGGGVFFDTGQQLGSIGFNGPGFSTLSTLSGSFSGPVAVAPIVNPPVAPYSAIVTGFDQHLQLPYTLQWNISMEQGLGRAQALTVSYVGSHGSRLLQRDSFSVPISPAGDAIFVENGLTSDYASLQTQFQRRLSQGMTALASYTWSHCIDYGSQNLIFGYQRGDCDYDVRHNISAAFSYNLPNLGHSRVISAALHNWGLDDRFAARTAFPVTLNGNALPQPSGQLYYAGLNLVPGQPIYLYGTNCASILQGLGDLTPEEGCPGNRAINPNAFTLATSGMGNAPRNFARGLGAWQMDLALRRDFPITERLKLQFRAEAFNLFNHPNFGAVSSSFGQPTFGQFTGSLASTLGIVSPLYQQGGPRSMQFALKLAF